MKKIYKFLLLFCAVLTLSRCAAPPSDPLYSVQGEPLPHYALQAIVGIPDNWDSTRVFLVFLEREPDGPWKQHGPHWPARLGSTGLVWGLGLNPVPEGGKLKTEGDKKTPAGVFAIDNLVFAYDPHTPVGHGFEVRQVTPYDLWVEDPGFPLYNQHLRLDHIPKTEWEKKQQMKLNDPSHKVKLFIHHNSPIDKGRPVAKGGSSIFFHIWRDNGNRATAGCTSMSEKDMMHMLARLDTTKKPVYIILPHEEYERYRDAWQLPNLTLDRT